jgi:glycosyltransferase involved in cell wall biosynthesis
MTNELPLVTIITPTYNYADYLPETIESILSQDYPNVEYIVLDDGSTDNTREVLEQYERRIIWETHENMGEPRTVNKGFGMSKGQYVVVVNADDPVLPGFVSAAVEFMDARPDILVGYPRWLWIDKDSEIIQEFPTYDYDYMHMLVWHHCFPGPGAVIRRRTLELEHGRDTSFRWFSDYDFWLRVGLRGPFARIPKTLVTQRKHPGARTYADKGVALSKEHIRTVENYYERADLPPEILAVKRETLSNVYYIAATLTMEHDWNLARQFFVKSVWLCPFCPLRYPNGMRRSWILIVRVVFFPRFVNRLLKLLWAPIKPVFHPKD